VERGDGHREQRARGATLELTLALHMRYQSFTSKEQVRHRPPIFPRPGAPDVVG
jgi:hypothetical protein